MIAIIFKSLIASLQDITRFSFPYCRAVSDIVGDLKGLADGMGGELDHQKIVVERVAQKTELNVDHLDQANQRINQL